jgi:hypothetical protein
MVVAKSRRRPRSTGLVRSACTAPYNSRRAADVRVWNPSGGGALQSRAARPAVNTAPSARATSVRHVTVGPRGWPGRAGGLCPRRPIRYSPAIWESVARPSSVRHRRRRLPCLDNVRLSANAFPPANPNYVSLDALSLTHHLLMVVTLVLRRTKVLLCRRSVYPFVRYIVTYLGVRSTFVDRFNWWQIQLILIIFVCIYKPSTAQLQQ